MQGWYVWLNCLEMKLCLEKSGMSGKVWKLSGILTVLQFLSGNCLENFILVISVFISDGLLELFLFTLHFINIILVNYIMSGRKSKKQTYFNDTWLNEKECDIKLWVLKVSTSTSYRCKVCKGSKDKTLGEAGIGALKKHAEGQAHVKNIELYKKTLNFFAPRSNTAKSNDAINQDTQNADVVDISDNVQSSSHTKPPEPIPLLFNQGLVDEAHIVWALHCVKNG